MSEMATILSRRSDVSWCIQTHADAISVHASSARSWPWPDQFSHFCFGEYRTTHLGVEAGQFFGELSLLQQLPRSASARARVDSGLLVLDPDEFDHLLHRAPATAAIILKNLARRVCDRLRD